jgi:hypothetical protein
LKGLAERDSFLIGHQTIAHRGLARFCQETDIPHLQVLLNDPQTSKLGNALILLGHLRDPKGLDTALTIALDRTKTKVLRLSALVALSVGATRNVIPTLIAALDESDQMFDQMLDCIGALSGPADIPITLPLFGQTATMLSTVFYRFASFRSIDALEATLDYLTANPAAVRNDHISSYAEFPLLLMDRLWNEEVRDKVAQLLLSWEAAGIDDSLIRVLPNLANIIRNKDPEGYVCRQVLASSLKKARSPQYLVRTIAEICTPPVAHWLIGQGDPGREVAAGLVFHAHGEVRRTLGSAVSNDVAAQDDYRDKYEREHREREFRKERERNAARDAILSAPELAEVVRGFRNLPSQEWPDLPSTRIEWLERSVGQWVEGFDCLAAVSWIDSRRFQIAADFVTFRLLLLVIEHYKLRLGNDLPVVHSLRGSAESGGAQAVIEYFKRCSFSAEAKQEFDRLFRTPALLASMRK